MGIRLMRAYATMFSIGVLVAACAQEKTEKKVDITPHAAAIRVIAGATPSSTLVAMVKSLL